LLAIIQARTSSKRFKNKVLRKIYGKSIINHVYNKIKLSKQLKQIIVATSNDKSDNKLVKHLKKLKIPYFRGDLENVAKRFLNLALKNKAKFFLRVSGDSPLIDYVIIDTAINIFKKSNKKLDLITNISPRTFPKGQSVEIVKTSTLKKYINEFSKKDKEHVTRYFYRNLKKIRIKNFKNKFKKKMIKQAIDTKKDFENIKKRFKIEFKSENKKN
tara:strand:+ start:53 stop:697 length:645 start_codon:yes stop_codon:yes gene_type:complete